MGDENCENRNYAWLIMIYIISIIIILFVFFAGIFIIVLIAQPQFLLIVETTSDIPSDDALPDLRKMGIFSAVISILITAILCIILACTKCRNYIPVWKNENTDKK